MFELSFVVVRFFFFQLLLLLLLLLLLCVNYTFKDPSLLCLPGEEQPLFLQVVIEAFLDCVQETLRFLQFFQHLML